MESEEGVTGVWLSMNRLWYNSGMIPQLTDEMRRAVEEHPDRPVYVLDRETHTRYVLLPADTYERVRALLYDDSDATPDEFLPLAHEAFQEDWDAPGMDQYQDYDSHRAGE